MKLYLGTKSIKATPMTRLEYNLLRGWELPSDEEGSDTGYLVEYLDGGKPNHPDYDGYISWSPEEVFNNAYKESGNITFGMAIELLKQGHTVARSGWNGKNMFVFQIQANHWDFDTDVQWVDDIDTLDFICMKTADNKLVPWLASQTDVLAEDWCIVE